MPTSNSEDRERYIVRHTFDDSTGQWINLIRKVRVDDKYKKKGNDEYGNAYYDEDINWQRDWDAIRDFAVRLPMEEFSRFTSAAQNFKDTHGKRLADEGMGVSLLSKLRARRREMEAGNIKDPYERARQLRMAGAEFTAGDSYGRALPRNFRPQYDGDEDRAEQAARDAAAKYQTLGLVQGMVNLEPGASTRMRTLEPLLVGYIRNANPEQLEYINGLANQGNLDGILKAVGEAAQHWEQDPNMSQYTFASAANRWNSPTRDEDIRDMQGPAQQMGRASGQTQFTQMPYSNPQIAAFPTSNPGYPTEALKEQPQQPPQPNQPNYDPSKQQPTQNFYGQPGSWAAPLNQYQQPRTDPNQGFRNSQTPGNFANTLGSMATQYGGGVLPAIAARPEPGKPPEFPEWGALIAAPNFEAASLGLFKSLFDRRIFFKQQAPLIGHAAAQAGITNSEAEYRRLLDDLYSYHIDSDNIKNMHKKHQQIPKIAPTAQQDVNYTYPNFNPPEAEKQEGEQEDSEEIKKLKRGIELAREKWAMNRVKQMVEETEKRFKANPNLEKNLNERFAQQLMELPENIRVNLSNFMETRDIPDASILQGYPDIARTLYQLVDLWELQNLIKAYREAYKDIPDDGSVPNRNPKAPRTEEEERYLRRQNTPHNRVGRILQKWGLYGWFDKNRRRALGFLGRHWFGIGSKRDKKPGGMSDAEWKRLNDLGMRLEKEMGHEDFMYFQANIDAFINEAGNKKDQETYKKFREFMALDPKRREEMFASGRITKEEFDWGQAMYRVETAESDADYDYYFNNFAHKHEWA